MTKNTKQHKKQKQNTLAIASSSRSPNIQKTIKKGSVPKKSSKTNKVAFPHISRMALPHFGQRSALSETSLLQSGHLMRGMAGAFLLGVLQVMGSGAEGSRESFGLKSTR